MDKKRANQTRWIYLSTRLIDTPLWAIYNMLPLILYKSLHATPFQIALVVALKPAVSILSIYWSAHVHNRPDRLVGNIVAARIIGCVPFLLFWAMPNIWLIIASAALYMAMAVGVLPAWMELLKRNVGDLERKQIFAYGSAVGYFGGGLLPLAIGALLDSSPELWGALFSAAALLALSILFLQRRLSISASDRGAADAQQSPSLTEPWRQSYLLLKREPLFLRYQMAFMIMGSGLMVIQPALFVYFVDELGISYFELALALALCKGSAYALASPLWAQWLNRRDIFRFTALVTAIATFFPLMLLAAAQNQLWLYAAYIVYGLMQAGSEMSWNMSGPIFSQEKESSLYTAVNVVSVGLRGCVVPALGGALCSLLGAPPVLAFGAFLFTAAASVFWLFGKSASATLPNLDY